MLLVEQQVENGHAGEHNGIVLNGDAPVANHEN